MPSGNGRLISHLPGIYHTSEDLCTLLSVLETVLLGLDGQEEENQRPPQFPDQFRPIARSISTIASLFDAYETPKEFLSWLAQWVALTHLDGLTERRQRRLLAEIVPLYAYRGTKYYMERLLALVTPDNLEVLINDRDLQGFVVGVARVGMDSRLAEDRPFWFRVTITAVLPHNGADEQQGLVAQWEDLIRRVIDLAKPAHTLYELNWEFAAEERIAKSN